MPRVFIAINLPEEIKRELDILEKEIQDMFPQELNGGLIKWVKKENLHITLLFLGSTKDEEIPELINTVKEIAKNHKPFLIKLKKVCYGPPDKMPPRLIWLEIEKREELFKIAEALKNKTRENGILRKFEKRDFSPHITLGRIRTWQWRRIEPEERPEIEQDINLTFEAKSIDIMESIQFNNLTI